MQKSTVNLISSTKHYIEDIYDEVYEYFYWQHWKEDRLFFITLALIVIIKFFVLNINIVPSGSMNPTLIEGDVVLVNKIKPRYASAKRGEIVTFDRDKYLVKRVVALAGDTVQIVNGKLRLNGKAVAYRPVEKNKDLDMQFPLANAIDFQVFEVSLDDGTTFNALLPASEQTNKNSKRMLSTYLNKHKETLINSQRYVVPEGHLFVMGDNHMFSNDSRSTEISFVKESEVVGQVTHTVLNIYRMWNNLVTCIKSESKCMVLRLFTKLNQ